ncbi:carbohydrate ABC transporter membrane protein 2, CUT1 family [Leifsonia sp. 98AMF]|jgi:multiple sugar transport system permease protein|uniref:carbohydrate ABC transporter permease n=1 Tax=Microbacteriaceae TaxID=85023 RepID=UPI00037D4C0F|nr:MULTISPECIES: carbohydrate ABC transporter permease [Microbacteriaceae]TDQ02670.1 carbohydrate ABC transporter membrane protein 2 (CUT1 family) [Leifsonia sp. 115AMFTsu3.1]SDH13968.1 carbohydrate ABC transporter membrane protein 2, CUT1 family [Leifsonia sp. 197AMF]SDJ24565.1 carbohydrate ABC transporter membrane protein 2, CUT1 family [Leifsonia sp. 466MF]SDK58464.1 carbohydrate ABC transporter membrane protein 2, CUT1 family [Leifsonia sp. 157MF]SDN46271.1 carbohydrate ABC transporter mem
MTTATVRTPDGPPTTAARRSDPRPPLRTRSGLRIVPTLILIVGALYCVLPVLWILIASTKTNDELFSTPSFVPSFTGGFWTNMQALFTYNNGIFGRWALNSVIYAIGGGVLSTVIAGAAGYALGKYTFTGSKWIFRLIVAAVLLPQIMLAIPQFLLLAKFGMTNTYASVILPQLVSPFAIYLCKIYAEASVPDEIMEAARIDGGSEWRIFWSVGSRLMMPALVTVFLLQFIGIWNNFLLPFVMINNDQLYPLTLGLYGLMIITGGQAAQYSIVIAGVLVSIVPLAILFLSLQRYWKIDLISGGVKL